MIKIIKDGNPEVVTKTIFIAQCYHCDCKYEFERQDTITMDKSPDGIIQMRCPYCKRIVTFSRRSVSTREEKIYK